MLIFDIMQKDFEGKLNPPFHMPAPLFQSVQW